MSILVQQIKPVGAGVYPECKASQCFCNPFAVNLIPTPWFTVASALYPSCCHCFCSLSPDEHMPASLDLQPIKMAYGIRRLFFALPCCRVSETQQAWGSCNFSIDDLVAAQAETASLLLKLFSKGSVALFVMDHLSQTRRFALIPQPCRHSRACMRDDGTLSRK